MSVTAAAQAIVDIAVSKMSLAVREVSVAKATTRRDFALVASGGAGPLHVLEIARRAAHTPRDRSALSRSFLGARHALGRRAARFHPHFLRRPGRGRLRRLGRTLAEMLAEAAPALRNGKRAEHRIQLDLRYVGQEFTLPVPVSERQIEAATGKASASPSTASTSSAMRTIRPGSRWDR